jgi:hypothetical protein
LGDIVLERAQLTFLEQGVPGVQHRQHFSLFIGDLNLPVTERAAMQQALAQHLPVGAQRLLARCVQAGKLPSFGITADIIAVAHMEIKTGHV